ncbi:FCD domain-containing protein [Thioclava sp. BHET1]|nr:FCD domain-containing protein [Thioclava sp. BHET1]
MVTRRSTGHGEDHRTGRDTGRGTGQGSGAETVRKPAAALSASAATLAPDGLRGTNQSGIRAYNERLVLSLLRRHEALAKSDLARISGLSAQTVSVIMRGLEAEGLIWRRQGKGTFIGQPPDPTGLLAAQLIGKTEPGEVMEARLWIEPALAALCAMRATPEDVARMRLLAERVFEAHDQDTAELWDSALHRLIARTAGNRPLMTSFALLDEIRGTDEWLELRSRRRNMDSLKVNDHQHHRIIDAIASGDAEAAAAAMRAHIQRLIGIMERNMARDAGMVPLASLSAEGDTGGDGPDREAIGPQHRAGIIETIGPEEERDG